MKQDKLGPSQRASRDNRFVPAAVLLLALAGALITYKSAAALQVIERTRATGALSVRAGVVPLGLSSHSEAKQASVIQRTINYFAVVWPALAFGILITAAVRAFVSPAWLVRKFGSGTIKPQATAALAGTPLMLCSCCAAPLFAGIYEKSARLGPSLALMIAAPALNPAALVLTFMLFESQVGVVRLVMSVGAVLLTASLASRMFGETARPLIAEAAEPASGAGNLAKQFLRSCLHVAGRTLAPLLLGVLLSMLLAQHLSTHWLSIPGAGFIAIAGAAAVGVLLALPTFFEIPLALALVASGAPAGVATALLIAGPAVNLPSLLAIARSAGWQVAALVAQTIWLLAVIGGLLMS